MNKTILFSVCALLVFVWAGNVFAWEVTDNLAAVWKFDDTANPYKGDNEAAVRVDGHRGIRNYGPGQGWKPLPELKLASGIVGARAAAIDGIRNCCLNGTPEPNEGDSPIELLYPTFSQDEITYTCWVYGKTELDFLNWENIAFQADDGYDAPSSLIDVHSAASNGGICWLHDDSSWWQAQWWAATRAEYLNLFADKWCHIAVSDHRNPADGSGVQKIYVNGVLMKTQTWPKGYEMAHMYYGAWPWCAIGSRPHAEDPAGRLFRGIIDDFRIYGGICLDATQIAKVMALAHPWGDIAGGGGGGGGAVPDGDVDYDDVGQLKLDWLDSIGNDEHYPMADLNHDRIVDLLDYAIMANSYGT